MEGLLHYDKVAMALSRLATNLVSGSDDEPQFSIINPDTKLSISSRLEAALVGSCFGQ